MSTSEKTAPEGCIDRKLGTLTHVHIARQGRSSFSAGRSVAHHLRACAACQSMVWTHWQFEGVLLPHNTSATLRTKLAILSKQGRGIYASDPNNPFRPKGTEVLFSLDIPSCPGERPGDGRKECWEDYLTRLDAKQEEPRFLEHLTRCKRCALAIQHLLLHADLIEEIWEAWQESSSPE